MESEFDKEIDALLRKAVKNGAAKAPVFDSHLDADEISMFAENATPVAARSRTINHLADCDRCRTILSNLVLLNAEKPVSAPTSEVLPIEVAAEKSSRFADLFSIRNLAFGFGTLALLFAGFIGFGVISNMNSENTQLASADKEKVAATAPVPAEIQSNSNIADSSLEESEPADMKMDDAAQNAPSDREGMLELPKNESTTGKDVARRNQPDDEGFSGSRSDLGRVRGAKIKQDDNKDPQVEAGVSIASENVYAAKPSQPAAAARKSQVLTNREALEKKKESDKNESEVAAAEEVADAVSTGGVGGDYRQVSGKSFSQRNGIWYDSAYKNQPTTKIRRGTAAYRSLDAGIRSIANQLNGTVVVVWKTKAYKIQ